MKLKDIFQLSNNFYSMASETSKEKVPPKTKDKEELLLNLTQLKTFKARIEYAEKNLERISSGSSRIVFYLNDQYVLKLASNEKGIMQNAAEANVKTDTKYVNLVTQKCIHFYWVIAPVAEKINQKEFEKLTGIPFEMFGKTVHYKVKELLSISSANSSTTASLKPNQEIKEYLDEEIVKQIAMLAVKYKLMTGDISRISSWGIKKDTPVLIDLGLNRKIYKKYYASEKSAKQMSKLPSVAE